MWGEMADFSGVRFRIQKRSYPPIAGICANISQECRLRQNKWRANSHLYSGVLFDYFVVFKCGNSRFSAGFLKVILGLRKVSDRFDARALMHLLTGQARIEPDWQNRDLRTGVRKLEPAVFSVVRFLGIESKSPPKAG